jgi:hypothetical protein
MQFYVIEEDITLPNKQTNNTLKTTNILNRHIQSSV